jgi:stage II sporulation protein P
MGRLYKMMKITRKRRRKEIRRKWMFKAGVVLIGLLFPAFAISGIRTGNLIHKLQYEIAYLMLREYSPLLAGVDLPVEYEDTQEDYETQLESTLDYDRILAKKQDDAAQEESQDQGDLQMQEESPVQEEESAQEQAGNDYISLEKLNDFDYLIQNFYTVDKSTTINSSQLNAQSLLEKNCTIQKTQGEEPQILIYHTHSQEGYSDSVEGDLSTTVMAVGDRLTQILQETYGYQVLHHTGTYDVEDRNHAYSLAAPDLEQILRDHPSIEVVIDLHRDGVGDDTRLVTEMNGTQMAQIMFFNGLSRSTATGDIDYLPNPYIEDNLAFSLQMQLAASEMYPGFARKIYLKSYRYNMHYCPKSLLIEVGAQTNTLQEALNAMEPLAAVLDAVLGGST